MKIKIYQVDAFTDTVFSGNPAAVCPLDRWVPDSLLLQIAAENNLAETAFYVREQEGYRIRWFTPKAEVDLCGHATLASAFVLFDIAGFSGQQISFQSRSGLLTVARDAGWYVLNFPADRLVQIELTPELKSCFGHPPVEGYRGSSDVMLVFQDRGEIEHVRPDLQSIAKLKARGIIVTARGTDTDFVSRFFAPQVGIDEDPVTGSAHTTLTPYWARVLGKNTLTARQISARGGYLKCKLAGDRVEIAGQAAFFLSGEISV